MDVIVASIAWVICVVCFVRLARHQHDDDL
jgi:hypothetical protein